jgi:hypothetical protein
MQHLKSCTDSEAIFPAQASSSWAVPDYNSCFLLDLKSVSYV